MNNDYNLNNQEQQNTINNNENVNVATENIPNGNLNNDNNALYQRPSIVQDTNNASDKEDEINNYSGMIIILFCIVGLVLFVFGNIFGLGIGIASLLIALFQIKKNPPFISIAILLSIVLCGLYIIANLLVTKENDEYLYRTRSIEYVNIARSYVESARNYVKQQNIVGCKSDSTQKEIIKIKNLESVFDGNSPFENKINEENSYVLVQAVSSSNHCQLSYAIYLTDGEYSIGKKDHPLEYEEIDTSSIEKEL